MYLATVYICYGNCVLFSFCKEPHCTNITLLLHAALEKNIKVIMNHCCIGIYSKNISMSFKMVYLEWSTVIEKAEVNNVIECGVSYI